MIKTFEISPEMLSEAQEKAMEMGALRGSILQGKGNLSGFVGEIAVRDILTATQSNTYNYDLTLDDGSTVDVKTQAVNSIPREYYECNLNEHSTKQECDYYAFARVLSDLSKGWYLGKIKKKEFMKRAKLNHAGSLSASGNFVFKLNTYTIKIGDIENG